MINTPQDMSQIITSFMALLDKKDNNAIFKMFAPDAHVQDFEASQHRGAGILGFFRDWPPRSMNIKVDKQMINDRMAIISLTLMGGGFAKPTPAKITMSVNDKWLFKLMKFELGG